MVNIVWLLWEKKVTCENDLFAPRRCGADHPHWDQRWWQHQTVGTFLSRPHWRACNDRMKMAEYGKIQSYSVFKRSMRRQSGCCRGQAQTSIQERVGVWVGLFTPDRAWAVLQRFRSDLSTQTVLWLKPNLLQTTVFTFTLKRFCIFRKD